MKKLNKIIAILLACVVIYGCHDQFLNKEPQNVLLEDQLFSNPNLVITRLGNLYDRILEYQQLDNWWEYTNFDVAFPSRNGDYFRAQNQVYGYGSWGNWDYGYVRDINLFLQKIERSEAIESSLRNRFKAEGQFLRADLYFNLVKRMGGVPILSDTLQYDFSGDPSYLRNPRNTEAEVYDYVISQLDSASMNLPRDANVKARATWGAAMAMKSRAALYAGSIARHGTSTPNVSLDGGEVGIPANRAEEYYQIALNSAQELIDSGQYSLYMRSPADLSENFAQLFLDKNGNPETIFIKDYKLKNRTHGFTVDNQPFSISAESERGGAINPSLNIAQSFEKLDNTFAPFDVLDSSTGERVAYESKEDIFVGRDARLAGTIILPGTQFKGQDLDIWAGYIQPDGSIISGSNFGDIRTLPGQSDPTQVVGADGPIDQLQYGTQTGFYIRKYNDPASGAGQIGTQSEVRWIRYRYGEVLLNAAEAAFELGNNTLAAEYMNQVRSRAGFETPLSASDITFNRVVHERRVELAFEGHQLWDFRRWRLAHVIWNGGETDLSNPGDVSLPSTRPYGLWPYKVFDPGSEDNGKWVYKRVLPSVARSSHQFRLGNYYSRIDPSIISNNPLLIQNPNQ